jgi:hypothetical protein
VERGKRPEAQIRIFAREREVHSNVAKAFYLRSDAGRDEAELPFASDEEVPRCV